MVKLFRVGIYRLMLDPSLPTVNIQYDVTVYSYSGELPVVVLMSTGIIFDS